MWLKLKEQVLRGCPLLLLVNLCVPYRLINLKLCVVFVAEQFIRPRRGELFRCMSQKQEVIKKESPQFLVALCFVHLKRKEKVINQIYKHN